MPTLLPLQKQLRALASPETAAILQGFFKTGKGQYGEGDVFPGIKVPVLRAPVKQHRDTANLDTIARLLGSKYHEERLFALLLLVHMQKHID